MNALDDNKDYLAKNVLAELLTGFSKLHTSNPSDETKYAEIVTTFSTIGHPLVL